MIVLLVSMSSFTTHAGESADVSTQQKVHTLIWDLGGVITGVSWARYASCIGLQTFLSYMAFDWRLPHYACKVRSFEVLERVILPGSVSCPHGPCLPHGVAMPPVMVAYQAGFLSREQILPLVYDATDTLSKESFFSSSYEKTLIIRTIEEMFNPEALIFSNYFFSEGVELIQSLASQTFEDGTRRYKLYVLSNWEPISFQTLCKAFPWLFSCFDGIVVSGLVGMMKPSLDLFEYIIKTYGIDKATAIFIDDQEENIKAAQSYGIGNALLFKSFTQLKQDLVACEVTIS